jgi:hypothetical protein
MPIRRFPAEFEKLLTAAGRRVLAGTSPHVTGGLTSERPFVAAQGLIDARKAAACAALLDHALASTLTLMEDPIPTETITQMVHNYDEWLPKTARVRTAYLDRKTAKSWRVAEEIGLIGMLRSESFRAFATSIGGQALRPKWGVQVLCYGPGDYAGPHNDHHPEDAEARDGYLDVHISLSNAAVSHQWLVYAENGHLSRIESVNTMGGVTAYRLPFWHYTTPLVAKPGQEHDARRWLLLGTFLFAARRPRKLSDAPVVPPSSPPAPRG